ncbi:MAG: PHP domain protein [Planctomycetes bacterium ADurb.Bin401]|jgi:hypothetical protein|nr:MAG: PHP domain protein [Planctomycetes bacterium ADurb.Bin401]
MNEKQITELEAKLDSFDGDVRRNALDELASLAASGKIKFPAADKRTNMHFHTFYSYNAEGLSPAKIAWLAKKSGLGAAGTVDFDVVDSTDEFYDAAAKLGLKASSGMETRVFVPEFADREINSPGEPGIAYHMATAIPYGPVAEKFRPQLDSFKTMAQQRNRVMVEKVNAYLSPVILDYDKDAVPLTPKGNVTERHLCLAYAKKAAAKFAGNELANFWSGKLGQDVSKLDLPDGMKLQGLIRSKIMKQGGVGYVRPDSNSFPKMKDVNKFIIDISGTPTLTWLNGLSKGEQAIEELLDIAVADGVAAVNIIPDRNYTPGKGMEDEKCRKLYEFVEICIKRKLPIIAGTEMNSPGQKFVDDFNSKELAPLCEEFYKGAMFVYNHTKHL